MLDRFFPFLEPHRRILLSTHENPDGDGTGAMVALAHCLRSMGKETRIVVSPSLPATLAFLDPDGWVESFQPHQSHLNLASWPAAWVLVDASEPKRMGVMLPAFNASKAVKACLDHHLKDAQQGFDLECTDSSASASAELVFDLVTNHLARPLPPTMTTALYAGLVDDTGNFRFSNTTPKVHRIAAALIEDGADPARIYQELYHQNRPERLRLFGKAYESLRILGNGRYGCLTLSQEDLDACGADHDDMEGLVNEPLKLRGVEVAALIYEMKDGLIKASLRSRGKVDVNAVCKMFGGGGHRLASGAKLDGPLDQVQTRVDAAVLAQLSSTVW
jgi:bifunctional oligoribonuclease and PAP phosphatase NrnA